jgi:hypothetical protein
MRLFSWFLFSCYLLAGLAKDHPYDDKDQDGSQTSAAPFPGCGTGK